MSERCGAVVGRRGEGDRVRAGVAGRCSPIMVQASDTAIRVRASRRVRVGDAFGRDVVENERDGVGGRDGDRGLDAMGQHIDTW